MVAGESNAGAFAAPAQAPRERSKTISQIDRPITGSSITGPSPRQGVVMASKDETLRCAQSDSRSL